MIRKFWALLIIIMIAVAGCGSSEPDVEVNVDAESSTPDVEVAEDAESAPEASPTPTCLEQATDFIKETASIFEEWDDAESLASNTPRGDLSDAIASLQEIKRMTGGLDVPDCASEVKDSLVALMEFTIDGFLSFLADDEQPFDELDFIVATAAQERFTKTFADLVVGEISEDIDLTYIALASSIRKNIKWRDSNGYFIDENAPSNWTTSFTVPPGFLARIEIPAGTGEYACAILFNGQIADLKIIVPIEDKDIVCEANAPSN